MAKDFQDVQQLDSEENDHQLSRSEGPDPHRHNHRVEDAFWNGKCLVSGALLHLCLTPDCSGSLSSLSYSLSEQGLGLYRCEVLIHLLAPQLHLLDLRKGYVPRGEGISGTWR